MRVRAKKMCFAEGQRRRKGAEFSLQDEANFSESSMVALGPVEAPEEEAPAGEVGPNSTVPEIKAELKARGIDFPKGANKAALVLLLASGESGDDESGDDESGDDESGDDESGDDESGDLT